MGLTFVYFIGPPTDGPVKIGATRKVIQRWTTLSKESPVPVVVHGIMPGGFPKERELHYQFRELRIHGEWFLLAAELREFISNHCEAWTAPPSEPKAEKPTKSKSVLACFACSFEYKRWLIDFCSRESGSLSRIVHEGLSLVASRFVHPDPPHPGKTRVGQQMVEGPTFGFTCPLGSKAWLADFSQKHGMPISTVVRTGLASLAEKRGHPSPPPY